MKTLNLDNNLKGTGNLGTKTPSVKLEVKSEELKKEWEIEFDEMFSDPIYSIKSFGTEDYKYIEDDIKSFISSLLAKQQADFVEIVERVEKLNDSNGRYNACQEILADIKSKINKTNE
jgi:hypothetical protein